jgi:hypothetical protein
MRTLIGRILSAQRKEDESIVRLARLDGYGIIVARIEENIDDTTSLPLLFPRGAIALFRGYYENSNGFNALGFEVMQR